MLLGDLCTHLSRLKTEFKVKMAERREHLTHPHTVRDADHAAPVRPKEGAAKREGEEVSVQVCTLKSALT